MTLKKHSEKYTKILSKINLNIADLVKYSYYRSYFFIKNTRCRALLHVKLEFRLFKEEMIRETRTALTIIVKDA